MQYYKTIDELLKGIGDITQSSVYQSVRTGANAPARNIAAIAQGKTLPYQRQLSSARKAPNVVNQIASIGTYTNPYLSPNKEIGRASCRERV